MFGYVRAVTAVLSPEEQARYRAVYCGLCKTLGERYGKAAQLTLNYDFVFLALLLAPPEGEEKTALFRCPAAPWKKKPVWPGDAALEAAADATVILVWWKLQDAIRDGGAGEKLKSRSVALALRRSYRAAAQRRPDFDRVAETCLDELHQLEEANTAYALLDWGVWEPLLGHILTIGLPAVEEAVFTGQWKQAKHPCLFQRDQAPALPSGETDKENKKL